MTGISGRNRCWTLLYRWKAKPFWLPSVRTAIWTKMQEQVASIWTAMSSAIPAPALASRLPLPKRQKTSKRFRLLSRTTLISTTKTALQYAPATGSACGYQMGQLSGQAHARAGNCRKKRGSRYPKRINRAKRRFFLLNYKLSLLFLIL